MSETEKIIGEISGGAELLKWMGLNYAGELTFGDSEIVEFSIRRSGLSVLVLWVQQLNPIGAKTAWAHFFLNDMIDVSIEGFAHQNVIGELKITSAGMSDIHPSLLGIGAASPVHHITLEPCAGAFGSIKATIERIEFAERPATSEQA